MTDLSSTKAGFGASSASGTVALPMGVTYRRYYYIGVVPIAVGVRTSTQNVVYYLHTDHLGSATLTTDGNGDLVSRLRYTPYGVTRHEWGNTPTDRLFTGQRWEASLGLYDYKARFYHPALGRFISAEPLVPEPGNPQSLNRYAYVYNNPLKYTDPSGHWVETAVDIVSLGMTLNDIRREGFTFWNTVSLVTDIASLVLPGVPAGASHVIRAARWVDNAATAINAAKAANNAADAGRALSRHADEAADAALRGAENAAEVASQINISSQARNYLQVLRSKGQVVVPRGEISARIMGEISAASGAEVGLFRLETGERVLVMGTARSVPIPPDTRRIIAHTHPSGILQLSKADIAALTRRGQSSTVLINLLGQGRRVQVPR